MTGDTSDPPLVVNGWSLYAHPLFLSQVDALVRQVDELRRKDPTGYRTKNPVKRLAAIAKLVLEVVPGDPSRPEFRRGGTLGENHTHWFRAKFFQQYRLFFRYHSGSRVIVFAWVNDDGTKRAVESPDDAYRVFRRMLENGNPPSDWEELVAQSEAEGQRLRGLAERIP